MNKPTPAFIGASWAALLAGIATFGIGLWNSDMLRSEKGFYAAVIVLGVFAAVSLQKAVRDRAENLPVTMIYLGLSWGVVVVSLVMLVVGLWNSTMLPSEKGFFGMSFALTLFAAVAVQKNVRDSAERPAPAPAPAYTNNGWTGQEQ